jgi:hypothetical protein
MRGIVPALLLAKAALAQPGVPIRVGGSLTLLPDNRVLVSGGESDAGLEPLAGQLQTWSVRIHASQAAGTLAVPRVNPFTAYIMPGNALALFGETRAGPSGVVEFFDADAGTWTVLNDLYEPRAEACWAARSDGTLVIAGGRGPGGPLMNALVFAPSGARQATVPLPGPAVGCGAAVDSRGSIIIVGGTDADGGALASVHRIDVTTLVASVGPPMPQPRAGHAVTRLADGGVLVIGGSSTGSAGVSAYVLLEDDTWRPAPPLSIARARHEAILLPDGRVLVARGVAADAGPLPSSQVWPGGSNSATVLSRAESRLLLLPTHQLLEHGGWPAGGVSTPPLPVASSVVSAAAVELAPPMQAERADFASVSLPDGRLLAIGGVGVGGPRDDVELFAGEQRGWTRIGMLAEAREQPGAMLQLSGEVLVIGGEANDAGLRTVERCAVAGVGVCSPVASLPGTFVGPRTAFLRDGRVLASGSNSPDTVLYDPEQNSWTAGPQLPFSGAHVLLPMRDGSFFAYHRGRAWRLAADLSGWTPLRPHFSAEEAATAVSLPRDVFYLCGGREQGVVTGICGLYESGLDSWRGLGSTPPIERPLGLVFASGQHALISGRLDGGAPFTGVRINTLGNFINSWDAQLTVAHAEGAARWLLDGRGLVFGGRDDTEQPTAVAEYLHAFPPPLEHLRPVILDLPRDASPGETLTLRGRNLLAPSGGTIRTADDRAPSILARRLQDDLLVLLNVRQLDWERLEFTLPEDLPWGHYALTVTVRSAQSVAKVVRVAAPLGEPCVKDWRCASWRCMGGVCVAPAVDAGNSGDGGVDGGGDDAGLADGGTPESGEGDGGAADAGLADSGMAGSGDGDGGALDAGLADGGLPDGGEPPSLRALHVGCGCDGLGTAPALTLLVMISARRRRLR